MIYQIQLHTRTIFTTLMIQHKLYQADSIMNSLRSKLNMSPNNKVDAKCKIQTNADKFIIVPVPRYRTGTIEIDNTELQYTNKRTSLGLDISTHGLLK